MAQPPPRQPQRSPLIPWLIRLPLLAITAVLLLFFVAALYLALHQLQYRTLIYPGVSAYGTDLSGMTREQAIEALSARFTYGEKAIFTFRDGDKVWQKSAADLGVSYDPARTADEAMRIGRGGGLFTNLAAQSDAWLNGASIQPIVVYDQSKAQALLTQIAGELNRPVQDATISLVGTQVATTPGQTGRELAINETLAALRQVILNMNTGGEIALLVRESPPAIVEAETVAVRIRQAIAAPIQIYIEAAKSGDPGPWEASPEFIGGLFTIKRVENGDGTAQYDLTTNFEPLRAFLNELAPTMTTQAERARFIFSDTTKELEVIQDSKDGREMDIDATVARFEAVLFQPENRRVPLTFRQLTPVVNSKAKAADLGITEKIVEATTFFYGSSAERRTNIQVAATRFHGLVVAPGETFSFNQYLGDVSPETGYETGLVIFGDRTIQGVGGGVCQVSTTIFQAAFFGGFPIEERYAHGYRVGYYESGVTVAYGQKYQGGVGMDATVYAPIIDFKFKNDTPFHLLMEAYFQPTKQSLTFKFYSTATGRIVTKEGPKLSSVVAHGPAKYTESADLKPGQTRQIDYAVDGVDARVWRTIKLGDQVIVQAEEFYSHYLPWSAQFLVAPGYAPKR